MVCPYLPSLHVSNVLQLKCQDTDQKEGEDQTEIHI